MACKDGLLWEEWLCYGPTEASTHKQTWIVETNTCCGDLPRESLTKLNIPEFLHGGAVSANLDK